MVTSRRARVGGFSLWPLPLVSLLPQWATDNFSFPRRSTGLAQPPMRSLLYPGSQYTWKLVCTLQEWSLCFPSPALKPQWPSKPNALGVPPSHARHPGWGASQGAQKSPVRECLWYSYFLICELLTQRAWDLIIFQECLSYHLVVASMSLDVEYLFYFLVFSSRFFQWLFIS